MSKKMPKSNKVILSEEDIISRNAKESADFAEKVEAFINSDLPPNEVIRIGTLNCLQVLNSPNTPRVPLVIPQSVLANALGVKLSGQTKRQHTEPHNISVKAAKQMPDHLRSPICICKGNRPNTVVIVTDLMMKKVTLSGETVKANGKTSGTVFCQEKQNFYIIFFMMLRLIIRQGQLKFAKTLTTMKRLILKKSRRTKHSHMKSVIPHRLLL